MAEIIDYDPIDNNNTARWPEGMPPSEVNDSARANEGILARWFRDGNSSLVATGTGGAYAVSMNQTITAFYDGLAVGFQANHDASAAPTLQVDALAAKPIHAYGGEALIPGDLLNGERYLVVFDLANDRWRMLSQTTNVQLFSPEDSANPSPISDLYRKSPTPASSDQGGVRSWSMNDDGGTRNTLVTQTAVMTNVAAADHRARLDCFAADGINMDSASPGWLIARSGGGGTFARTFPYHGFGGMSTANASPATRNVRIEPGQITDHLNVAWMRRSSNMIKDITQPWAAGTSAGGYPNSGPALTANTWYHIFGIRAPSNGNVDFGFDSDVDATNLLADSNVSAAGYTQRRRIMSVLTDGSSNIVPYTQIGPYVLWSDPVLDVDVTNQGTTGVLRKLSVPKGVRCIALMRCLVFFSSGTRYINVTSPDTAEQTPSNNATGLALTVNPGGSGNNVVPHTAMTNTSQEVRSIASGGSTTLKIATYGWIDLRGQESTL